MPKMDGRPSLHVDYDERGIDYVRHRRADPRIAARIHAALGDARTVVNVGAGAGSYEPTDRRVVAVEPNATMRRQRAAGSPPCIAANAESLPFETDSVDAAMACVTIHHWPRQAQGLAELRRVARGPVVIFTFDLRDLPDWQREIFREAVALEEPRFGTPDAVAEALGGRTRIETIPTPADCTDGFFEAFWNRPEALLADEIRASQSVWGLLPWGVEETIVERLRTALESGEWDRRHGDLRELDTFDGALRLIVSEPDPPA